MSLGLSIFLSSLVIGTVLLYRFTYDRWNWRTIFRRLGFVVLAVVIVGVGVVGAIVGYELYESYPRRQTTYAEIALGMNMNEVIYIKGFPKSVLTEAEKGGGFRLVRETKDFDEGESVFDYSEWSFDARSNSRIDVEFDPTSKLVTSVSCYSQGFLNCPRLMDLFDGTKETNVIEKLGEPDVTRIEGVTKSMAYGRFNAVFYLQQREVYMLGIRAGLPGVVATSQ